MNMPARAAEAPLSEICNDSAEYSRDARFMAAALSLGRRNLGETAPNPAVGALIVRFENGQPVVVGRGITAKGGRPHAETEAVLMAGEAARGATTYVTLEPCAHHGKTPPCANAIISAGIARAVIAVDDPNPQVKGKGIAMLRAAGVEVVLGVGAEEARIVHAGHFRRVTEGRPQIILKIAVSADGKTALSGRRPAQISCTESMAEAHMLRATSDAILIGSGTAIADDPMLTCRLPGMAERSPIRVILDSDLNVPVTSRLVSSAREVPVWFIAKESASVETERRLLRAGASVLRLSTPGPRVNPIAALKLLGDRGITRVLVEGGPILAAVLISAGLVDEAVIVQSPRALGADAVNAIEGMPLAALTGAPGFKVIGRRMAGVDTLTHYFRG